MIWLLATHPTILHPVDGPVPFTPRPYQKCLLWNWQERARLVVKSRQLGFSQAFAAEAYWKATHQGPRRILVVSRNLDAAMEFVGYVRGFAVQAGDPLTEDNKTSLTWPNGSRLKAEAATRSAGRSFAASDVYLDEFAHAPWALAIWQAVAPTVATGGTITVFSSPKGRNNVFYRLWAGQMGREQWARYRIDWRALWGNDPQWEQRQRAQMTREQFAEEYGADFIESGGALFRADDIAACWQPVPSTAGDAPPQLQPQPNRDYLLTIDPAGAGEDATVLQVWDVTEPRRVLVQTERWTEGPFERTYQTARALAERYRLAGAADVWIDQTGLGAPMVEELGRRLGFDPTGFTFTRGTKEAALTALQLAIQQHALRFDDPQLRTELELYQRDDAGLVTDCVMAAALMAYACANRPGQGVWL